MRLANGSTQSPFDSMEKRHNGAHETRPMDEQRNRFMIIFYNRGRTYHCHYPSKEAGNGRGHTLYRARGELSMLRCTFCKELIRVTNAALILYMTAIEWKYDHPYHCGKPLAVMPREGFGERMLPRGERRLFCSQCRALAKPTLNQTLIWLRRRR
jgi:hypothetical protein